MANRTPQGLQHALNERARRHGVAGDQVLRRFLFARLLAQVSTTTPLAGCSRVARRCLSDSAQLTSTRYRDLVDLVLIALRELAHALLDPVLDGRARLMTWVPEHLAWADQPGSTA